MSFVSQFAHLFPPPSYLTLKSVGIDISDSTVKYIQFSPKGKELTLTTWGEIPMPAGAVVRGRIEQMEPVVKVLREVREKCGVRFARLSLPEERAYLFKTDIEEGLSREEITQALEFRLEENVPLPAREAHFDFDVVSEREHKNMLGLAITVYGKETVLSYYNACREAGLVPLSFETEAQAMARAVVGEGDEGTYMLVDFGKIRTGIGIVELGSLLFTATIDVGGENLDQAIKTVRPQATPEELITLKNEHGILQAADTKDLATALLGPVTLLKNEIAARISYWDSHTEDGEAHPIEKIILSGGIANLKGLPEFLSEELGLQVEEAQVWRNAFKVEERVPPITKRHSYGYATAIGLALGGFSGKL